MAIKLDLVQLEEHSDPQREKDKDQYSLVEIQRKQNVQSRLAAINDQAFHIFVDMDNDWRPLKIWHYMENHFIYIFMIYK